MSGYYLTTAGGDIAVLPSPHKNQCMIRTSELTEAERAGLLAAAVKLGIEKSAIVANATIPVGKSLGTVAKVLRKALKAGREVITVFKDTDGKINEITMEDVERVVAEAKPVATVEKPRRGCPFPHSPAPRDIRATAALRMFLNDSQAAQFGSSGACVVTGGHSGYQYIVAHRYSQQAHRQQALVKCHDTGRTFCIGDVTGLPASEEMLALVCMLSVPDREREFLNAA